MTILLLLLLLTMGAAGATSSDTIIEVLEEDGNGPIQGVLVSVVDTRWSGITDPDGLLSLPELEPPITLSLVRTGYSRLDTLLSLFPLKLTLRLCRDPIPMPAVVVKDRQEDPGEWKTTVASRDTLGPGRQIDDVLNEVPGVRVQESGTGTGLGGISIRGSSEIQTETWLDGMPMTHSRFGTSDMGGVLPGIIERLNVYQGWTPLRLGGTGIGGGVELSTVSDLPSGGFRIKTGIGNLGRVTGGASGGTRFADGWVLTRLEYLKQKNTFTYVDDNTTPLNATDDTVRTRENNKIEVANLLLKSAWNTRKMGKWTVTSLATWRREGVPGPGANPVKYAHHDAWEQRLVLKQETGSPSKLRMRTTVYQEWFQSDVSDPEGELNYYSTTKSESGTNTGGRFLFMTPEWRSLKTDARFEGRWERFHSAVTGGSDRSSRERRGSLGMGLGLTWRNLNLARWRGEGGLLWYSDQQNEGSETTNSLTTGRTALELNLSRDLQAVFSLSLQKRPPTLLELFGNQGSVKGNSKLESEKGRQVEAVLLIDSGLVRFAAYLRKVDNLIHYWLRSPRAILPENIGEVEMKGMELSFRSQIMDPVLLIFRISNQITKDLSGIPYYEGNVLPGCPEWRGSVTLRGRVQECVFATMGTRWESDYYLDRANKREEDGKIKLNAGIALKGPWRSHIRLDGDNLTDETGNDQWGYPLAGRRWRLAISFSALPADDGE